MEQTRYFTRYYKEEETKNKINGDMPKIPIHNAAKGILFFSKTEHIQVSTPTETR